MLASSSLNTFAVCFFGCCPIEPVVLFVTGALTTEPTSAADSILCASATSEDALDNDEPDVGGSAVIGAGADSVAAAETDAPQPPPPDGAAAGGVGAAEGDETVPPPSDFFRVSISF